MSGSDPLTPSLRAEIDARVASGQITMVPMKKRGRGVSDAVAARRRIAARYFEAGNTTAVVVEKLAAGGMLVSTATVNQDKKILGFVTKKNPDATHCALTQKKMDKASSGAKTVRDRRRFKVVPVPFGEPSTLAPEGATGPMFPSRVFTPDGSELVLKDGCNNCKVGGDVLIGRLKGAYIATLTLPERTTCPKTCKIWRGCYGNSMHYARRWAPGPELEAQIRHELEVACEKNELVLIRLHVLGDFYSFEYLCLWAEMLDTYENLHVFGFTAWLSGSEIGDGVAKLRCVYPERFMVRTSGTGGEWGSFTLPFPTKEKQIGDAIVCPEQLDGMEGSKRGIHCGNCAVCWSTSRPIAFVEH